MAIYRTRIPADTAAVDGISEVVSTRSADAPTRGMIYHPGVLAAVTPVHLHPLTPGRYLMVFSRRWHDATVSATDPGAYLDDYAVDTEPGWVIVSGTGTWQFPARSVTVPGPGGRTLTAATSWANSYLYLLSSLDGNAFVQHFRWHPERDMMLPLAEEIVPAVIVDGQTVTFDKGVFIEDEHLVLVGSGSNDNRVYLARKSWARVGTNRTVATGGDRGDTENPSWRYATATGWSTRSSELAALPMTTLGPVSAFTYRTYLFMAVVIADGDDRYAQVWRRHYGNWSPVGGQVLLGSVADGSYLGGTMQFQRFVRANASDLVVPYLTAVRTVTEVEDEQESTHTEERIDVSWNNWTVVV